MEKKTKKEKNNGTITLLEVTLYIIIVRKYYENRKLTKPA